MLCVFSFPLTTDFNVLFRSTTDKYLLVSDSFGGFWDIDFPEQWIAVSSSLAAIITVSKSIVFSYLIFTFSTDVKYGYYLLCGVLCPRRQRNQNAVCRSCARFRSSSRSPPNSYRQSTVLKQQRLSPPSGAGSANAAEDSLPFYVTNVTSDLLS